METHCQFTTSSTTGVGHKGLIVRLREYLWRGGWFRTVSHVKTSSTRKLRTRGFVGTWYTNEEEKEGKRTKSRRLLRIRSLITASAVAVLPFQVRTHFVPIDHRFPLFLRKFRTLSRRGRGQGRRRDEGELSFSSRTDWLRYSEDLSTFSRIFHVCSNSSLN